MIQLKRILLPTEFSDYSQNATADASKFANEFGSELYLLHVLQDLIAMVPEPGLAQVLLGSVAEKVVRKVPCPV